ncbi:permease [Candidatus Magnetomorum sp. HK-1]|nr:permease [Candidatus Magnetomorum sp. HK-1]
MLKKLLPIYEYLIFWIALDILYITVIFNVKGMQLPTMHVFFISHAFGIFVASMVMFTGLGAGVLWLPLLTVIGIPPSEAISLSIFTQIAGKGIGTINFIKDGIADLRVIRQFLPFTFVGITLGYIAGFVLSLKSERLLLLIFIAVAFYLLIQMLQSLYNDNDQNYLPMDTLAMKNSRIIVVCSSFFTGLLSIGNSDWLIPHMQQRLKMSTARSVATGIVIMFFSVVFYLLLTGVCVCLGLRDWPQNAPILFSTCSGVMMGGQIGTRLTRFSWLKKHQKHAFIILLALSIIHLLW